MGEEVEGAWRTERKRSVWHPIHATEMVCVRTCVHVCVCVRDLQESQHVSQSEPAHLCGLPYLWMTVIQHRLGEARCPVFSAGLPGNLCPTVGVCERVCMCMHLNLSFCASVSIS